MMGPMVWHRPAEDVPPLLSLSGLRQEFHRIETDTDAFIEEFFSQVRRMGRGLEGLAEKRSLSI
jgi:hypothetical protein